jgi:hypothetical protein
MLTAEFLNDHLAIADVPSEEGQRAVFQSQDPSAVSDRASPYLCVPSCPRFDPDCAARKISTTRYNPLPRLAAVGATLGACPFLMAPKLQ